MRYFNFLLAISLLFFSSCSEDNDDNLPPDTNTPNLVIKLKFDPDQIRLGNLGQPVGIPVGNAAQSPTI
ncbi:MAG: hypothetical protein HRU26_08375, partial [Psychroserpens sp.]|nr:hypothetical protein [Psychroserpens sp.]